MRGLGTGAELIVAHANEREKALRAKAPQERDELLREARQAETTAHINEWLSSPGLAPPK